MSVPAHRDRTGGRDIGRHQYPSGAGTAGWLSRDCRCNCYQIMSHINMSVLGSKVFFVKLVLTRQVFKMNIMRINLGPASR